MAWRHKDPTLQIHLFILITFSWALWTHLYHQWTQASILLRPHLAQAQLLLGCGPIIQLCGSVPSYSVNSYLVDKFFHYSPKLLQSFANTVQYI
jgi:hypothetical protein